MLRMYWLIKHHWISSDFGQYMMGEHQELDLLIRRPGEVRLSNFLLWQCAYAEMIFTDTAWPDFNEAELHRCATISAA